LWRCAHEREAWWKLIVDAKYGGMWDGRCSLDPPRSHGVGLYKNIRKGWSLFCSTRFILGHRSRIRFWHDVWCGEMILKKAFPVLYGIARDKDALVAAHLVLESGSLQWDVNFMRAAHEWEVEVLASFFTLLYSIRVRSEGDDKLWWTPSHKGKFDVSSFYKVLACKEKASFPWRSIWRTKVPLNPYLR